MYRKIPEAPSEAESFPLPFEGKLSEENRWVVMSKLIPWSKFEEEYALNFAKEIGAPAKSFRMALGALIIKEKLGISDRETVEQIRENPYLQYFIGLSSYSNEAPFDPSLLVHFRERIKVEIIQKINEEIVKRMRELTSPEVSPKKPEEEEKSEKKNRGKLIIDATCVPADIKYPTDLELLNQGRKLTEKILDILYKEVKGKLKAKPKTYRKQARKEYLKVAKQRKPSVKKRRKAIQKQLQYLQRNLGHIEQLTALGASLKSLTKSDYKKLLVVAEIYRQQQWMYENKKQSIEDRIVSVSQPHIRPIVRGKAGKSVEFGAKISASCIDGYVFLDKISWNNFNESVDLKKQIEAFKEYTGYYPESVHVDKIYRNRENRDFCKSCCIRMSGPPLGRPPKNVSKEMKKQARDDERIRNTIEGKFGQGKRRFSLNRVMTKQTQTSVTAIAISFLVMNLSTCLRQLMRAFLCLKFKTIGLEGLRIIQGYVFNCYQQ